MSELGKELPQSPEISSVCVDQNVHLPPPTLPISFGAFHYNEVEHLLGELVIFPFKSLSTYLHCRFTFVKCKILRVPKGRGSLLM